MADAKPVELVIPPGLAEFGELVRKTDKLNPKPKDVQALRRYLEHHREVWRVLGDVAEFAYNRLVDAAVGEQTAPRESLKAGKQAMREDLGYRQSSALERILIDQIILCWLRLHHAELKYTEVQNRNVPLALAGFWERKLSATQRRHLRACETLARIRKLRLPSVQVNIAKEQINVAAGEGFPTSETASACRTATPP